MTESLARLDGFLFKPIECKFARLLLSQDGNVGDEPSNLQYFSLFLKISIFVVTISPCKISQ